MVNLYVNNNAVTIAKGSTLFQACQAAGIQIPRFCFHERLLVAGNCRICLVEVEKSIKPVVSCATPVIEGVKVFTKTPLVFKAREAVIEFLLINHPLDCPICDQAGECDLQNQSFSFGTVNSRYNSKKRAVISAIAGPFIKTIITRCIHCTRCLRYSNEISGTFELGISGRGNNVEINFFIRPSIVKSYISGNIIDLCPVGSKTIKIYY